MSSSNTHSPIALVNGHFNILHPDHIRLFEFASQYGIVIVGINDDKHNIAKNGSRAVLASDREYAIKSCRYVDRVIVFPEPDPVELIKVIKPNFLIKGPDYLNRILPEQTICDELKCKIVIRSGDYIYSSSLLM